MQNKQNFKGLLLVSDIDGTLATLNHIPEANLNAIQEFQNKGGAFALCTGRPKCAIQEILEQIEVNAPIITINGGYIYSPEDGSVLSEQLLPENAREFTFQLLKEFPDIGAMLVEPDNYWVICWGDESITGVEKRKAMYLAQSCCKSYYDEGVPDRWHKVVLIVPPERMSAVRGYIEAQNPEGFYPVQSDAFYLELVPDGVEKGKGMELIKTSMGFAAAAAIGDRENDQSMLIIADFSAVPQDGEENLKKKVDFIVDSCDNGAVADFIAALEKAYKPQP